MIPSETERERNVDWWLIRSSNHINRFQNVGSPGPKQPTSRISSHALCSCLLHCHSCLM